MIPVKRILSMMMFHKALFLFLFILPSTVFQRCDALSSSIMKMNTVGAAEHQLSKNRLSQALSSPISGKLSFSPEIHIKDSSDPTSLLLLSTYVNQLSESLRLKAKANAVFWQCSSLDSLQQFASEQQTAKTKIPGPLPIIYCYCNTNDNNNNNLDFFSEISKAGASGVLVTLMNGKEISTVADLNNECDDCSSFYQNALSSGLHAIPEVVMCPKSSWSETDVESLVDAIKNKFGFLDPAAVLFTFGCSSNSRSQSEQEESESEVTTTPTLPIMKVPATKNLGGTAILGSVRTSAGEGRLGNYVSLLKNAGFSGAVLRSDCIPVEASLIFGSTNLEMTTNFWCAAIAQLKSVRSKNFSGFRAKNQMNTSGAAQWASYTSKLLDEGVLNTMTSTSSLEGSTPNSNSNADRGDYAGF